VVVGAQEGRGHFLVLAQRQRGTRLSTGKYCRLFGRFGG